MHPISADSKSLNYTNAGRVHKSRAVARIITSLLLISAAAVTILFGFILNTDITSRQYVKREDHLGNLQREQLLLGLDSGSYYCPCNTTRIPYNGVVSEAWFDVESQPTAFSSEYTLCNRRPAGLINISDIYCAQLFEDLQNKIDEGSFVSVKLESISALADNLQTEVEGIASAAKVAVVTNTLVYLRIFNINDSDPIRTNEQVSELNRDFYPQVITPFISSITGTNVNASSPSAARGALSPNVTINWDTYYRICKPKYCEITVGKNVYTWVLDILASAWGIFKTTQVAATVAWVILVYCLTKWYPSWSADSELFDTLIVPARLRWTLPVTKLLAQQALDPTTVTHAQRPVSNSPKFRIRGSMHTWRLRAFLHHWPHQPNAVVITLALQVVEFKNTPDDWKELVTYNYFLRNSTSTANPGKAGPVDATFARPNSEGVCIMGEQQIAEQWWDTQNSRWKPVIGHLRVLDGTMNLYVTFESHAEIETQLMH